MPNEELPKLLTSSEGGLSERLGSDRLHTENEEDNAGAHQRVNNLLSPRAVPVWAISEIDIDRQRDSMDQKIDNKKDADVVGDLDGRSNISTGQETSASNLTSPKSLQVAKVLPPSPPLAAASTSIADRTFGEDGNEINRWSKFVKQSKWPSKTVTDGLQNVNKIDRTSQQTPLVTRSNEQENQAFIHPRRRIISISDLESQMDLSGPWNPNKDHLRDSEPHNGEITLPPTATHAWHHHSERNTNEKRSSSVSSGASAVPFQMTADIAAMKRKHRFKVNFRKMLLNNPYVPLTLRSTIFALSVMALGLATSVFRYSKHYAQNLDQQPSTYMAICVQSTALVYLLYITYDEYSGKPLGLREARDKVKLIMLDLFFIILSSANLSLTFNTLYDQRWICQITDPEIYETGNYVSSSSICRRQRGLASMLFLILLAWVMTFTISIFRVVERVSGGVQL
ncbi:hypothetical protein V1511DRAFT_505950 [Dipodascopsis uninucleata]